MSNDKNDDDKDLITKAKELMRSTELSDSLAELITEKKGGLGFVLSILKRRPRTFNPFILKGLSLYSEPEALDKKTAELVAVSAASALKCEHCLESHMKRAIEEGASMDEVLDTILISGGISDSSTLSVAMRKYRQLEGKVLKKE